MNTISSIKRLHGLITKELFYIDGTLCYDRITEAFTTLANAVHTYDGDNDDLWYMSDDYPLDDIITGAYWHFSEWHNGQWSTGYAALSALGSVYTPNMERVDTDNIAYIALNDMAEAS